MTDSLKNIFIGWSRFKGKMLDMSRLVVLINNKVKN